MKINIALSAISLLIILLCSACQHKEIDLNQLDRDLKLDLVDWNKKLTNVIVEDIFTPPVCSRIYAYPNIAAYEVLAYSNENYPSYTGNISELEKTPTPSDTNQIYKPLSASVAFAKVAQSLVYSQDKMADMLDDYIGDIEQTGLSRKKINSSVDYGKKVAAHILKWAGGDGYLERSAKPEYTVEKKPGKWIPTPPDYMPAIEPYWNTIRPFTLDSANQFNPLMSTTFDLKQKSKFYKEAEEVYDVVNSLDEEQLEIAKFWDCNPNVSNTRGHLMFFDQKISPGGHWMSIAGITIADQDLSLLESARIFSLTAITIADAFISCWDEKYRSSVIRPETYINEHIDPSWKPILQTPAFPEYTSGHSVISSAAALMLTKILGDNISFIDSTEVQWGLPVRTFDSFYDASDEAAISRLYGGIHYMPAIENGVTQGKTIGDFVVEKLQAFSF